MTVEKYDSGKTRELADVYGVGNCLRKYRDVATANSGKCPLTIEADVIDSDSAKIVNAGFSFPLAMIYTVMSEVNHHKGTIFWFGGGGGDCGS